MTQQLMTPEDLVRGLGYQPLPYQVDFMNWLLDPKPKRRKPWWKRNPAKRRSCSVTYHYPNGTMITYIGNLEVKGLKATYVIIDDIDLNYD